ncbi:MAG: hypothetical protein OXI77_09540 [Chloroflexota bacterium]|nr:hypothetical protein [Chloroflexota bacterium]MDE2908163.1 hypothetical protein [Chloroflexota bacterium]
MSAQSDLRHAIELMQDGEVAPAVDLLNRLVGDSTLDDKGRAAAYVWLAEARADSAFKIRCLEQALAHDPDNRQIRQGLGQLAAERAKPGKLPPTGNHHRHAKLAEAPLVIGIVGGLNGPASGAFVNSAGLIATTSYAIGGAERVTVTLDAERRLAGVVVRRLPTHDLALIETTLGTGRKQSAAPPTMIAENTSFIALGYGGARLRGALARHSSAGARQWLRTTIPPAQMLDAGGNPLYDEYGQILGLLTRNVDGAGNALAASFSHVASLAEQLQRDRQLMPESRYCAACGSLTRAALYGGRHCETCGAAKALDHTEAALPPQIDKLAALYREDVGRPCVHCGARVGGCDGRCLRCGRAMASGAVPEA